MSGTNLTTPSPTCRQPGKQNIMRPQEGQRKRASTVVIDSEAAMPDRAPASKKVGQKLAPSSFILTMLLAAAGAARAVPSRAVPTHHAVRVCVRAPQAAGH